MYAFVCIHIKPYATIKHDVTRPIMQKIMKNTEIDKMTPLLLIYIRIYVRIQWRIANLSEAHICKNEHAKKRGR